MIWTARKDVAVGRLGQLIAVFFDPDIGVAVTARKFIRFGELIDGVSAAVKS